MAVIEILVILAVLCWAVISYFRWSFSYWERKKVPYRKPAIPLGNSDNPISNPQTFGLRLKKHYDYFKAQGEKHAGIYTFTIPIYMPFDPEYIKNILVKDFDYFADRGMYSNVRDDPLTGNVFFLEGTKWKNVRSKIGPAFTSGKMKLMFNILVQCCKQMVEAIEELSGENKVLNIKEMVACYTTDVISSCAFGLECNSCRNPNEDFRRYGRMVLDFSKREAIRNTISTVFPNFCRSLGVILVKPAVSDFFLGVMKNVIEYREKNKIFRKDFLQLLMDIRNSSGMTVHEMAAEAFAFYVAGFETSSNAMTFAFLELALNSEVQDRAREEINDVLNRHGGEMTYEALGEMTYLQQVFDETLRKYPITPVLLRKCVKDYNIPQTNVTLDKGTRVFISILAIHRDADNFFDPEKFDPERFGLKNRSKIKPFTYLPFGDGPRNCMGLRFATMQSKLGLATVLRNFRFFLNKKTKMPVTFNPYNFVLKAEGGVYLNLEKIHHY